MEYVENARRLVRNILSYSARIPKRYQQRLANALFNHATETYYHAQCAHRTYVKSDADYNYREHHLREVLSHTDHMAALLDIAFDVEEKPNENVYEELAQQIDKERALVKGVIKKDKKTWSDNRERGK